MAGHAPLPRPFAPRPKQRPEPKIRKQQNTKRGGGQVSRNRGSGRGR